MSTSLRYGQAWLDRIIHIESDPWEPLASHHFVLIADLKVDLEKPSFRPQLERYDRASLNNNTIATEFVRAFGEHLQNSAPDASDVDAASANIVEAFHHAEKVALPVVAPSRRKPWISDATLSLIDRRRAARASSFIEEELILQKAVRKSARIDRKNWLLELAGNGGWSNWNKLRRGQKHTQGRLQNAEGGAVSSNERADTFATYLQDVQWAVRHVTVCNEEPLFDELRADVGDISVSELRKCERLFKNGKAAGPDEVPMEFWKVVLSHSINDGAAWLADFCNSVWAGRRVPDSWNLQRVTIISKKGAPEDCGN